MITGVDNGRKSVGAGMVRVTVPIYGASKIGSEEHQWRMIDFMLKEDYK